MIAAKWVSSSEDIEPRNRNTSLAISSMSYWSSIFAEWMKGLTVFARRRRFMMRVTTGSNVTTERQHIFSCRFLRYVFK